MFHEKATASIKISQWIIQGGFRPAYTRHEDTEVEITLPHREWSGRLRGTFITKRNGYWHWGWRTHISCTWILHQLLCFDLSLPPSDHAKGLIYVGSFIYPNLEAQKFLGRHFESRLLPLFPALQAISSIMRTKAPLHICKMTQTREREWFIGQILRRITHLARAKLCTRILKGGMEVILSIKWLWRSILCFRLLQESVQAARRNGMPRIWQHRRPCTTQGRHPATFSYSLVKCGCTFTCLLFTTDWPASRQGWVLQLWMRSSKRRPTWLYMRC